VRDVSSKSVIHRNNPSEERLDEKYAALKASLREDVDVSTY